MTRANIERRVGRISAIVEARLEAQSDQMVVAILDSQLLRCFSLINEDGTLPDDYEEQMDRLNQQMEEELTPEERAAIERFSRRYHAEQAKEELLQQLEMQIRNEEGSQQVN